MPWRSVVRAVGHASIAVTDDTYQHLIGTIAQKAVVGAASLFAHRVQMRKL